MSVRCHAQAEAAGLIHSSLEFLHRKFLRFGIAAVGEHGAAGKNLDVVNSIVCQLADFLANFPGAVCFAVMQVPRKLNIGGESRHSARAASDGDVSAGHVHARSDDEAFSDGIAHRDIVQSAIDAHVANRSEARFQHFARVGNGLERHLRSRPLQLGEWVAVIRGTIGQVGVAIDQAGQNRHAGEVNDFRVGGNDCISAYSFYLLVSDHYHLAGENGGPVGVNQASGFDDDHLAEDNGGAHCDTQQHCRRSDHVRTSGEILDTGVIVREFECVSFVDEKNS